jgi:murein DD-endopeptidase MepM/ murein hydrolase activator NlpD
MPRQAGSNAPNIENIDIPNLTDNTQQNFQGVMSNTLSAFQSSSQALQAQAQVSNNNYNKMVNDWQRNEQAKQQSSGGGGALGNIGELGKTLVSGYVLLDEMKSRKEAAKAAAAKEERDYALKERAQILDETKYVQTAEQQRQEKLQSTYVNALDTEIINIEGKINQDVASASASQGFGKLTEYLDNQVYKSEYWKFLSPESQISVVKKIEEMKTRAFKDHMDEISSERKTLEQSKSDAAYASWYQVNLGRFEKLKNGSGSLTDGEVDSTLSGIEESLQETLKNDTLLSSNQNLALNFYTKALGEISSNLRSYYGDSFERNSNAARWVLASESLATLDVARKAGHITEGVYQLRAKQKLLELGIESEPDKFPSTERAEMQRKVEDLTRIKTYNELVTQDQNLNSIIGRGTPQGDLYYRSIIGNYVFNGINSKGVSRALQDMRYLQENNPAEAQKVQAPAVIELLSSFEGDTNKYRNLNKEFSALEQKAAALGYNPPAREYTVQPGQPNVIIGKDGSVNVEYQTKPEITLLERPGGGVPGHSADEIQAVQDQMEEVEYQRRMLLWKWGQYGVDINNPSSDKLITELNGKAKAVEDYVQGKNAERNISSSVSPADFKPTGSDSEVKVIQSRVRNDVLFDLSNNKILEQYVPIGAYENDKQREVVKASYFKVSSQIVGKILNGDVEGADQVISNFKSVINQQLKELGQPTLTDEQIKRVNVGFNNVKYWVNKKKQVYNNRYSEQSRPNEPPSNFSSGSGTAGVAPATQPKNETPMRPSTPLKGNLGVLPGVGYAPFKGGNVLMTSGYMGNRPSHKGIDLVSSDKRVATVQGGTVLFASNWGTFGNVVFVKTPDNKVEVFAHLSSINVKKGQVIDPATPLGVMGNTGKSFGEHLHFEVWGNGNFTDPATVTNRNNLDPVAYLKQFQGRTTLPTVTGGDGGGDSSFGTRTQRYNTGAFRLSNDLIYFNGNVVDTNGNIRKASESEYNQSKTATPIFTTTTTTYTTNNATRSDGSTSSYIYQPPQSETGSLKSYVVMRPAGYASQDGTPIWYIEGYSGGVRKFSKPAKGQQLSDGRYVVAGRSVNKGYSDGVHFDLAGEAGAGGVALVNKNDLGVVNKFVSDFGGTTLYVISQPTEIVGSSAPRTGGNAPVNLSGKLSIHRKDYSSVGSPDADYGYRYLRDNADVRKKLYSVAQQLDVPMVWIADQLFRESNFDPTIPSPSGRHKGIFQIDVAGWGKKLGFDESLFVPGKSSVLKQLDIYVKYMRMYEQEVGKKIDSFEELLLAVWGSGALLKKYISNPNGFRSTDGYVDWNGTRQDYRSAVGRSGNRRYQWTGNLQSRASDIHDMPKDSCPVCTAMQRATIFNTHYYS